MIFPGVEMRVPVTHTVIPTASDVVAIRAGRIRIYSFGELRYFDVFGKRHTTRFCGLYDGVQRFGACRNYNDAD